MIPKIIHYCWFGGNPKPELAKKCINSWGKKCPGYEIIEWNESNYSIDRAPQYVKEAYQAKKWAFVTDYVRLDVVYKFGGIYLDTDVELLKNLDNLLIYQVYMGFQSNDEVATGLGFGAEKGNAIIAEMKAEYSSLKFLCDDGTFDTTPCPVRNTGVLLKHGLIQNGKRQILEDQILILPSHSLCPIDYAGNKRFRLSTISIHWFSASWYEEKDKGVRNNYIESVQRNKRQRQIDYFVHFPNRVLMKILGKYYKVLKRLLGRM